MALHPAGDTVVIEWRAKGTHLGTFRGKEPTRRRFRRRGCAVLEIADGLIVRVRDYYDRRTLDEQLGL